MYSVNTTTNRYNTIAGNSLTYDDAGNLTTDKDGYTYAYDYENRIIKIKDPNSVNIVTYMYDALSRRILKNDHITTANTRLYYYSDNWQVLAEHDGTSFDKRYVYGNYIDEVLYANDGTDEYFYLHDHLFSPAALLEDDGTVAERYEYDAYGKVTIWDGTFSATRTTSLYSNDYFFTGRRTDTLNSGNFKIQYSRNRYYDTETGRFLQHDPLGITPNPQSSNYYKPKNQYADGLNIYEYVKSQVISKKDPLGLIKGAHKKRLKKCKKAKCKGSCGPDISTKFHEMVDDVESGLALEFSTYPKQKKKVCGVRGIYSPVGWDINEFFDPISVQVAWPPFVIPYGKYCDNMVTLDKKCVNKWELNYYLWGLANKVCGKSLNTTIIYAAAWSASRPDDPVCKVAFATAGYYKGKGFIGGPLSKCDMSSCCKPSTVEWQEPLTAYLRGSKWYKKRK